jgi:alpha-mannosidase
VLQKPHKGNLPEELSFLSVDQSNVFLDTIKKSECGKDYIIRMYENHNQFTQACCTSYKNIKSIAECDLLENNISEVTIEGNKFEFMRKPFEIKTFKFTLE